MTVKVFQNKRDYYAGGLMMIIGAIAGTIATTYDLGSLRGIGPGFFPLVLSVLLVVLGVAIMITATQPASAAGRRGPAVHGDRLGPDWRGWPAIFLAVIAFVVLADFAGLAPATFACVFVAALGDRDNDLKSAALLALGLTVFAVVVLAWGLEVQMPVFGRL
jgi:hypothetical protein